jgi:hypothetical protein
MGGGLRKKGFSYPNAVSGLVRSAVMPSSA